jgi:hypothetical protein
MGELDTLVAEIGQRVNKGQVAEFAGGNLPGGDGEAKAGTRRELTVDVRQEFFEDEIHIADSLFEYLVIRRGSEGTAEICLTGDGI